MKVYQSLAEFNTLNCAVATTGTFDGVHLGHKKILSQLVQTAHKVGGESVLLTFSPHPRLVLQPDVELQLLTSLEEKIGLLEQTGLDHLIIHPFTKEFSRTPSLEFVREILVNQLGVKQLVIGYDHHFGRNREGSFHHLKEFGPIYGFEVEEIPALDIDAVNISSTKIRTALTEGNVELATTYLGHPYIIGGEVIKGDQIGRSIGFPTANLDINFQHKLIPADAVYAGYVRLNGEHHKAMANIGRRPTVRSNRRSVEIHLLDFEGDLYGQRLHFAVGHRLRDVMNFNSLDALKTQLALDKEDALSKLA
ncbi:MAG: bifunctional riboflavin kinase/FAD synthetase [Flavobacteriales bacterium]